ncbi:MAG: hypothetical protein IJV27_04810 [Prevotella sp.]|nr:hypothetical protein [Prevotella sp.]
MRKLLFLAFAVVGLMTVSCHQDEDELFTYADITLLGGDTITIERVQATARLTNLNTRQVVSTSDFDGATARVRLLRGAYSISVEGAVRYKDSQGATQTKRMRAYADYAGLEKEGLNQAELNLIFLE